MRWANVVLAVIVLVSATEAARAQAPRAGNLQAPRRGQFSAIGDSPVSPYLNLGTTSSGVSNYQTLVRPLIEEREALRRQWAALEQINQDLRGKSAPPLRQPNAGHFMHYSHYYGAPR
jgi:hypothetical protein